MAYSLVAQPSGEPCLPLRPVRGRVPLSSCTFPSEHELPHAQVTEFGDRFGVAAIDLDEGLDRYSSLFCVAYAASSLNLIRGSSLPPQYRGKP